MRIKRYVSICFRTNSRIYGGVINYKAIHLLKRLVEKYKKNKREVLVMLIDLEKIYDKF